MYILQTELFIIIILIITISYIINLFMLQMDLKRNTLLDTESEVVRKEDNILCLCVCVCVCEVLSA